MWTRTVIVLAAACAALAHLEREQPVRAVAALRGRGVEGNVTFTQLAGRVLVEGTITGLPPGRYGFHVHERGDITGGCLSTGSHFNPEHKQHGAPTDENRHVGDLGNVEFGPDGAATLKFEDAAIALSGEHCIIGRGLVLHEREDDLGRSQHPDSRSTGNAGGRVACAVIGILDPVYGAKTSAAPAARAPAPAVAIAVLLALLLPAALVSSLSLSSSIQSRL